MNPAKKAAATRQYFQNIRRKYGTRTEDTLRAVLKEDKEYLAFLRGLHGRTTMAATLANVARGTYDYNAPMHLMLPSEAWFYMQ